MESQQLSTARRLCCKEMNRSASLLAAWFGVAALLFTGQGISQTRIADKVADQEPAVTSAEQIVAAPSAEQRAEISAPSPQVEEASLARPPALLYLSAQAPQNGGESSSQDATPSSSQDASAPKTSTKAAAAKTKPPHHGLGIALATIGTTALVAGVIVYAGSHIDLCSNEHGGGCEEARVAGLVLMPAGGAVAFTGFYLQFHR